MKHCPTCKTTKPVSDFFKRTRSKDGYQSQCKVCAHKHYATPGTMDKYKARNRAKSTIIRERFTQYKAQLKCSCCPENNACCLDFHHLDPTQKDIEVSAMISTYNWDTIMKEINKCIVVCKNCHTKIHAGIIKAPLV